METLGRRAYVFGTKTLRNPQAIVQETDLKGI